MYKPKLTQGQLRERITQCQKEVVKIEQRLNALKDHPFVAEYIRLKIQIETEEMDIKHYNESLHYGLYLDE